MNTQPGEPASDFLVERHDAILRLTINRPRAANAINEAVAAGIASALAKAGRDDAVHAVILTGTGERAFSAGRDMKNPHNLSVEALNRLRRQDSEAYTFALLGFHKPLVVAVNGVAIGAGWMLAMHADHVIAAEHAILSMPEVDVGIATFLGHALLTELASGAVANDLVLSGRKMPAQEALRHGLVNAIVPAGTLAAEAMARAAALAAKPPGTFAEMKGWILRRRREAVERAYREHDAMLASRDATR